MSDTNNTQESPPVKRPRGRPKGSKNKPKPEGYVAPPRKAKDAPAPAPAAAVNPASIGFVVPADAEVVEAAE